MRALGPGLCFRMHLVGLVPEMMPLFLIQIKDVTIDSELLELRKLQRRC